VCGTSGVRDTTWSENGGLERLYIDDLQQCQMSHRGLLLLHILECAEQIIERQLVHGYATYCDSDDHLGIGPWILGLMHAVVFSSSSETALCHLMHLKRKVDALWNTGMKAAFATEDHHPRAALACPSQKLK